MVFPRNGRFVSKIMALWLRKMMTHQFCAHHFPGNPSCWEICHPLLDPHEAHTYQDVFGAQLRLSSGFFGGSCASRAGWVSVFPTFPVGCRSYESSFPKTWWTMAMVTEGEGPQPWAMGISCAPTGTRRRLACEKWWEDGDKRCVLEGCSCAWADSCWFWTLFLKILACHFCNLREGDELGLRPEMSIGWAAQTAGRHVLTPPLIWKHKTIRMPLGQTCEPERRQQKLMEKCNQMHHALVIPNMDPNHTYWCLADRLIRLGFSIALRPTLSVCAWCQGANTKAWVDSVALSQPKSL